MHSFGYRLNAVVTFSVTILAVICAMASISDNLNSPSPTAEVKLFVKISCLFFENLVFCSLCIFRSSLSLAKCGGVSSSCSATDRRKLELSGKDEVADQVSSAKHYLHGVTVGHESRCKKTTRGVDMDLFSVFTKKKKKSLDMEKISLDIEKDLGGQLPPVDLLWNVAGFLHELTRIDVLNINWFQKQPNGNDEVSLTLNISADLQSMFTWNTKQVFVFVAAEYETPENSLNQVSLWDGIIPTKEYAKFWIHTTNKYRFVDQGSNLRGKDYNLTLHWHVMPKTGKMFADKIVMTGYRLPEDYR